EDGAVGDRLDSWKAIAEYLGRDISTVIRWEKSSGLPVRRVPTEGRGRSVFAFKAELDRWLAGRRGAGTSDPLVAADADPAVPVEPPRAQRWPWLRPTTATIGLVVAIVGSAALVLYG